MTKFNISILKFILGYVIIIAIIITTAISEMPTNVLSPSFNFKNIIVKILPQGWGFFTRNPRENEIYPMIKNKEGNFESLLVVNSSLKNWFGFKRISRVVLTESSSIVADIPDSLWVDCKDRIYICEPNKETIEVKNKISLPTIKGVVYFKVQEKMPWAWSKLINNKEMNYPYKIAKVLVK